MPYTEKIKKSDETRVGLAQRQFSRYICCCGTAFAYVMLPLFSFHSL